MKQTHDSFELIAEGARSNWLAARAANDIGSCIPPSKIPLEELEALHSLIENEFRARETTETIADRMVKFDQLIADLTGE